MHGEMQFNITQRPSIYSVALKFAGLSNHHILAEYWRSEG